MDLVSRLKPTENIVDPRLMEKDQTLPSLEPPKWDRDLHRRVYTNQLLEPLQLANVPVQNHDLRNFKDGY